MNVAEEIEGFIFFGKREYVDWSFNEELEIKNSIAQSLEKFTEECFVKIREVSCQLFESIKEIKEEGYGNFWQIGKSSVIYCDLFYSHHILPTSCST